MFTEMVTLPFPVPLVEESISQLPPVMELMAAVHTSDTGADRETPSACREGFPPPGPAVKLTALGFKETIACKPGPGPGEGAKPTPDKLTMVGFPAALLEMITCALLGPGLVG